jgi:AGCS family alanine or glycine:cation symporter
MGKALSSIRFLTLLFLSLFGNTIAVQAQGVDEKINAVFARYTTWFVDLIFYQIPFTDTIQIPWVLLVLFIGAVYFTLSFRWINVTQFRNAIRIVTGKYEKVETQYEEELLKQGIQTRQLPDGEVSKYQALSSALAGTLGLGNVAGVAVAVSIGGAGATFWMVVSGLLAMASKFVECTLGVKYRDMMPDGKVYGGPMSYLQNGFAERGLATWGKILATLFAILCVGGSLGGGNMFQANQAFKMVEFISGAEGSILHGRGWLFGVVLAILVGIVIIGGIKKIAQVADKLVPFMVVIYILASLSVILIFYKNIPHALAEIMEGAFTASGVAGGVMGAMIQGFKRASFSNEAGIGSASIAHSTAKTHFAASEGLVSLLEPFVDTVLVCTMTALVIVVSNQLHAGGAATSFEDGVLLTSRAFASGISWFPYVLTLSVCLFAFCTLISWSYYGVQAWAYLFGRNARSENVFKVLFCLCIVIGSSASFGPVCDFSDAMIFAMMVPNMIGLFVLAPTVRKELKRYLMAIKKSNE